MPILSQKLLASTLTAFIAVPALALCWSFIRFRYISKLSSRYYMTRLTSCLVYMVLIGAAIYDAAIAIYLLFMRYATYGVLRE